MDFCMNLNTKPNRKKLVRTLFTVHRTRYDLLPFYCRLVATLHPCMPDLAAELVNLLKGDFKWHVRTETRNSGLLIHYITPVCWEILVSKYVEFT